ARPCPRRARAAPPEPPLEGARRAGPARICGRVLFREAGAAGAPRRRAVIGAPLRRAGGAARPRAATAARPRPAAAPAPFAAAAAVPARRGAAGPGAAAPAGEGVGRVSGAGAPAEGYPVTTALLRIRKPPM